MASQFDPKLFMDLQVNGASSTERIPVPAQEWLAVIKKVETRAWTGKQDPSKSGIALDVQFSIDDPNLKAQLGRDEVTLQTGIMLDLSGNSLDMSKGKNVQLGRLRDACDLNDPSKPFSFRMLEGKVLKILVSHKPSTAPGARPGDVFENVDAFAKA